METFDIIIVGGGISGISLARYCDGAGLRVLLLEREDRPGGTIHTHHFTDGAEDFWVEMGAHTCYNSYGGLISLLEEAGGLSRLQSREKVPFRILDGNDIRSIPSQINKLELLFNARRLFTLKKEGLSLEEYYSAIVGKNNFRNIFNSIFNAVPVQESVDFPAEMLFKKRNRRKDILKKFTMQGGLQTVAEILVAAGTNTETHLGAEAVKLDHSEGRYQIETADGKKFQASKLALAVSPDIAAGLLQNVRQDLADVLGGIKTSRAESVGVAVDRNIINLEPMAALIPREGSFFSMVSRDTVKHESLRGFTFHFKPDLLNGEEKREHIAGILKTDPEKLDQWFEKVNLVPAPRKGHNRIVEELERKLRGGSIYLTGNYFGGMAIEDCVNRSVREFARLQQTA